MYTTTLLLDAETGRQTGTKILLFTTMLKTKPTFKSRHLNMVEKTWQNELWQTPSFSVCASEVNMHLLNVNEASIIRHGNVAYKLQLHLCTSNKL